MALTRDQKTAQLADIKDKMQKASSVMFAHYIGLKVSDIGALRGKLRQAEAEMKVCKKTLLCIAAKELNMPKIAEDKLTGPVACIFSFSKDNPMGGATVAAGFAKDHEQVKLIGGIFEGKLLSDVEAKTFASLPSRQALLGMFISVVNAPLTRFVGCLNSPLSGFARALSEIGKKKESAAPAAAAPAAA